jgi:hypothetical protein
MNVRSDTCFTLAAGARSTAWRRWRRSGTAAC